jgi:tetratricopeptide (TPR) repeat protein
LRFLVLAGDRASNLDVAQARIMYERALELAPEEDPVRGEILQDLALVEWSRGRFGRSRKLLEEALPRLYAADKLARAASSKVLLALVLGTISPPDAWRLLDEAIAELERLPPGKELVNAYAMRAGWEAVAGLSLGWADKSLSLAEELGLPDPPWARIRRGGARCRSGDMGGLEDIHRGIDLALDQGWVIGATLGRNELSLVLAELAGPAAALQELELGAALARRSGMLALAESIALGSGSEVLYHLGRWDEMLGATTAYLTEDREDIDAQLRLGCQMMVCAVSTWRRDLARASELSIAVHQAVSEFNESEYVVWLGVVANLALANGDADHAASVLRELESYPSVREARNYTAYLAEITRVALGAVGIEFAQQLATGIPESPMALRRISVEMVDAQLAEAHGELDRAVELYGSAEQGWRTFSVPERAQSLLGQGRCLLAMGDPEAGAVLREANEVFASLKAELYIPEVSSLLEQAVARPS